MSAVNEPNKNNGKKQDNNHAGATGKLNGGELEKRHEKKPDIRQVLADTLGDFLRLSGILQRLDGYLPKHIEEHKASYEKVCVAINAQNKVVTNVCNTVADLQAKISDLDTRVSNLDGHHAMSIQQHDKKLDEHIKLLTAHYNVNQRIAAVLWKVVLGLVIFVLVGVSCFEYFRFTELQKLHERIDRLAEYQKGTAENSSSSADEKTPEPGSVKPRSNQKKSAKSEGQ